MQIRTNYNRRPTIPDWELSENERKQFDYIDWPKMDRGEDSATFFRYKGDVYNLHEFTKIDTNAFNTPNNLKSWDAYQPDSYYSGLVIRHVTVDGDDYVIVGSYTS